MNADGQGLLRAIFLHPDEMDRRLVYADWLEENGQEVRANYIRGMAEWPDRIDLPALVEWPDSLTRLLGYTSTTSPRDAGWDWKWRRGFIEEISCPASEFLLHAETLFRHHPITRVTLTDMEPRCRVDGGHRIWIWDLQGVVDFDRPNRIPEDLFSLLVRLADQADPAIDHFDGWRIEHSTREVLLELLSAALVAYGCLRAGLGVEALGIASEGGARG